MSMKRSSLIVAATICVVFSAGCAEETSQLKVQMAELEKRFQKQEKDLKEFSAKFSLPRDFSADIQRIEDQQDKVSQAIKTKLDPVNAKLEEFREWAQDAQKEREESKKKLKAVEDAMAAIDKRESEGQGKINQVSKAFATDRKALAGLAKGLADVSKSVDHLRTEFEDNKTKIIEAVKKTLPKVKDAAVADIKTQMIPTLEKEIASLKATVEAEKTGAPVKQREGMIQSPDAANGRLAPLEKELAALKSSVDSDRKALAALKSSIENDHKTIAALRAQAQTPQQTQASPDALRHIQTLNRRIKELEDILTSQKQYLLEIGSKVHNIETKLRNYLGGD